MEQQKEGGQNEDTINSWGVDTCSGGCTQSLVTITCYCTSPADDSQPMVK